MSNTNSGSVVFSPNLEPLNMYISGLCSIHANFW